MRDEQKTQNIKWCGQDDPVERGRIANFSFCAFYLGAGSKICKHPPIYSASLTEAQTLEPEAIVNSETQDALGQDVRAEKQPQ